MEQIAVFREAGEEQRQAAMLHLEILQAARTAVNSLLELGRKLKQMRDTGGYRELGFGSFGEYTEAAVGLKQRQAYNYIQVVETLPARLIEENAAAGVTKLALLSRLSMEDREELTGENLASITVAELKKLIEERDAMKQQLSLFQEEPKPVAEPVPVDQEALRQELEMQIRTELEQVYAQELQKVERAGDEKAKAAAEKEAKKLQAERAKWKKAEEARVEKAAREAAEKAEKAAYDKVRAAFQEAREERDRQTQAELEEARQRAETLAKQLEVGTDEDGVRFALLFEQLQDKALELKELAKAMAEKGKPQRAQKYLTALKRALEAMGKEI